MSFITKILRYLVVISNLVSTGYSAHHLPCGRSMNSAIQHVVCSNAPRFARAAHPLALNLLTKNPDVFQRLCNHCFLQSVPLGDPGAQWLPFENDTRNSFIEFVHNPLYPTSTEVQFTFNPVWSDTFLVSKAPSSDAASNTFIYNLIMNPDCSRDSTIIFDLPFQGHDPFIVCVTQMGLGSDRLTTSKDPETKAWIEFLTQAHLKQDISKQTPDSIAAAYLALDLSHWPEKTKTQYYDSLIPKKTLTKKELAKISKIIGFCLKQSYPLATMVKYTGLCPSVINTIIDKLKQTSERAVAKKWLR